VGIIIIIIIIEELVNGENERKRVEKEKTRFCEEVIIREKKKNEGRNDEGWKGRHTVVG
jgi:hypothetical protein